MKHFEFKSLIRGSKGKGGSSGTVDPAYLTPPSVTSGDAIINNMTFQSLDLISEGPIQGFVDEQGYQTYVSDGSFFKSVYLDESPIRNGNGSYNYQRVKADARLGYSDQSYISTINRPSMEYSISKTLYGPYVYNTGENLAKYGKSSVDNRPAVKLANSTSKGTNYSYWADESVSHSGLEALWETYTIKDKSCRYFSFTLGVSSLYDTACVDTEHGYQDGPVFETDWWSGKLHVTSSDSVYKAGETYGTIVEFTVEWGRLTTSGVEQLRGSKNFTIWGYAQSTSYIDFGLNNYNTNPSKTFYGVLQGNMQTFDFPSGWDGSDTEYKFIRFKRKTPETYSTLIKRNIGISKVTEYTPVFVKYPLCALGAIKGDSKIFTQVPKRNYHVRLMKVFTPNNYRPLITSGGKIYDRRRYKVAANKPKTIETLTVYKDTWDYKTLIKQWTDNPVWIALDLLTSPRYGLGAYITMEDIDMFSFYEAARYCDDVDDDGLFVGASDGYGGLEPLYHCSVHIKERMNTLEVLNSVLSLFDGSLYWESGKISITYTAAASRVRAMFNNRNVIDGVFSYTSTKRDSRFNVVEVTYQDQTDLYRTSIEYRTNEQDVKQNGPIKNAMNAWGCTSKGMARRIGDRYLTANNRDIQSVSFAVGYEGLLLQLNDIIVIDDDLMNLTDNYGRLVNVEYVEDLIRPGNPDAYEDEDKEDIYDKYCVLTVDTVIDNERYDEILNISVYRSNPNIKKTSAGAFSPETIYSYTISKWWVDEEKGYTYFKIDKKYIGEEVGGFMIGTTVSIQTKDYASQIFRIATVTDNNNGTFNITATYVSHEEYAEIAEKLANHYLTVAELNGLPIISNNGSILNPDADDEEDYSDARMEQINSEYDKMMGILKAPDKFDVTGYIDDTRPVNGVYMGDLFLNWELVDNASGYQIKVKNSSNKVVYNATVDDPVGSANSRLESATSDYNAAKAALDAFYEENPRYKV
jgi:hypothetical protein